MTLIETVWFNLAVQFFVFLIGSILIRRATARIHHPAQGSSVMAAIGHGEERGGSGWQEDPLTKALTKLDAAESKICDLESELKGVKETTASDALRQHFVTREEFDPVKRIVYLAATLVITTAIGSILAVIWKTGASGVAK